MSMYVNIIMGEGREGVGRTSNLWGKAGALYGRMTGESLRKLIS